MRVLVTGGAGYIGSHVVWQLLEHGHQAITFDNLSTGHADAVQGTLIKGSLCRSADILQAMAEYRPEAVMHFAARSLVGESVTDPRSYFYDNLVGALNLLDAMQAHDVQRFVFSSTAATYGNPIRVPIDEEHPQTPVNPYGDTKLAIERMLIAYAKAYGLRYAILRYFNAAGAAPEQNLGERHDPETHLIPLLLKVALGQSPAAKIFGRDYKTPDGTCLRDYIHVLDLAQAHLAALDYLVKSEENLALNLGTGTGHSVMEVIECARSITGAEIPADDAPRREGDPPELVAAADRAKETLNWIPTHSDLPTIISTAWKFMKRV